MKCPCCGYDSSDKRDYDKKSSELLNKRDDRTRKMLIHVIKKISKIESIPKKDLYYFLQNISSVSDLFVYSGLNVYDNSNPYQGNKGMNYLKAIIMNFGNIAKKQEKNISKRIGGRVEKFDDGNTTE